MVFAGYAGAVGLFSTAGIFSVWSMKQGRYASQIEGAIKNDLPDVEGKTTYVAIECMATLANFPIFPEEEGLLIGHVNIQKLGIDLNGGLVIIPSGEGSEIQIGFPVKRGLSSIAGPVLTHHLDLASWIGATKKVRSYTSKEAAIPLRNLDLQPDLLVDGYQFTVEGFEKDRVCIFGEATKREGKIHINPPSNGLPFLVTTDHPKAFVLQERLKAEQTKKAAITSGLAAVALGNLARTRQLFVEMQEYHEFELFAKGWRDDPNTRFKPIGPRNVQMFACFGICIVSTLAALHFGLFRKPSAER
jgi:hypothetical protein